MLLSAYFLRPIKYSPNTVVILFNSQKYRNFDNRLVCETWTSESLNENETVPFKALQRKGVKDLAYIRQAFLPIPICQWTTFIAVCKAAENSNQLSLSNTKTSSSPITVPLRHAYEEKHEVISCFSPLFYNERWQLLITSMEIFRQFGVNLQVYYIQSIRKELVGHLPIYEELGHVAVESWVLIDLGFAHKRSTDPNKELDWRNQGAAHTDCFLKYRESADFIIISDIDDILFPQLGKKYIQEFRSLAYQNPFAAGFSYNRYNIEVATSKFSSKFSLSKLLNSVQVTDEWENGKSIVIPSKVETVWIHYPAIIKSGYSMVNLSFSNENQTSFKEFYDPQISQIFHPKDVETFVINAKIFIKQNAKNEFKALPSDIHYYPLMEKCYNEIFYSKKKNVDACPGPTRCRLPAYVSGFSCVIAKRKYTHHTISKTLKLHFPTNKNEFELSFNGCRM
uniref:Glycosyltransferase family 92 protein n=1 Tax=Panagrolaimus davidi TaxID=227884 RepID=A0A914PUX1_9BILA